MVSSVQISDSLTLSSALRRRIKFRRRLSRHVNLGWRVNYVTRNSSSPEELRRLRVYSVRPVPFSPCVVIATYWTPDRSWLRRTTLRLLLETMEYSLTYERILNGRSIRLQFLRFPKLRS